MSDAPLLCTMEDFRDAASLLLALADAHDRMAKDAARYRWLTTDHDDPETRRKCRDLLDRMAVISYSAASRDIDAAMEATTKQEGS